jgi:exopolyphosphatase / guanosine-5'-triphosphate,3'-diphosphate pyrophosphatase
MLRLLRTALTDDDQAHARLLEPLAVAVQLHRVVAAERSAVVAQENHDGGILGPEVPEPQLSAAQIPYPDLRELPGVTRRSRALLVLRRSEHAAILCPVAAQRIAVVDLGTNSTRLLVADVVNGEVRELERRTNVTRLGEGVDAEGSLSEEAMSRVYDAVGEYRTIMDGFKPARVVGIATSAVRDADNGEEFRRELEERFAVETRILSGDEEARLTFLGATAERERDVPPTLVIDIGGGSTEFVAGPPGSDPDFHVSTQLGSVRQTERHLRDDPPTEEQLDALSREVAGTVRAEVPADVRESVRVGIAVAGTPTSLAAIDQELERPDRERVHRYPLRPDACERMLAMLASVPLERRREVTGLHPDRAPTIVAGVVILVESMRAFGLPAVEVSEADVLHGTALESAAGG